MTLKALKYPEAGWLRSSSQRRSPLWQCVRELADAGVELGDVQQAYAGYVYGDSTCGQNALYRVGMTGVPVVNVNNSCSTGSSALWLARQAIAGGGADCVLAFGFEQMQRGALKSHWDDRPTPFGRFAEAASKAQDCPDGVPMPALWFGGRRRPVRRPVRNPRPETFARITVKARRHAANNPYAVFRDPLTVDEVLASPHIYGPLTRLQCCPPTCGAAAAILCSQEFARHRGLDTTVAIAAQALTTDTDSTFADTDMTKLVGYDMAQSAARQVYEHTPASTRRISGWSSCTTASPPTNC